MQKPAVIQFPIHPLLQQRWSPRAFDATRLVSNPSLLSVLEAARWSPSSANSQPWRFIVAQRQNEVAFQTMLQILNPNNQRWCKDVPVLLMIITRTINADETPNRYGAHDAGIALGHLMIQTVELGLISHAMAGFNVDLARTTYAIPEAYTPMTIVAVGYQGTLEQLPEDLQTREQQPRQRLPLTDLVFEGQFGTTAALVR